MSDNVKNFYLEKDKRQPNRQKDFYDDFMTAYANGELDFSYKNPKECKAGPPENYRYYSQEKMDSFIEFSKNLGLPDHEIQAQVQDLVDNHRSFSIKKLTNMYNLSRAEAEDFIEMSFPTLWEQEIFLFKKGYKPDAAKYLFERFGSSERDLRNEQKFMERTARKMIELDIQLAAEEAAQPVQPTPSPVAKAKPTPPQESSLEQLTRQLRYAKENYGS
ncbi:MAG: hypothetical protein F6J97_18965 [Leptolyngbya sp. SIO4C1]|nr:hypothetical protein [Leptolyngbya sp. SIO4C1]